ncbi:uncharacterized protein [Dermacentor albipictus]|uniref:uncharacterized protein isoform X2 n=1 Tax=Dermacentor albipictus TaxID=60249 RepID=UPI0031FC13FD
MKGKLRGRRFSTRVTAPSSTAAFGNAFGCLDQTPNRSSFHVGRSRVCPDTEGKSGKITGRSHIREKKEEQLSSSQSIAGSTSLSTLLSATMDGVSMMSSGVDGTSMMSSGVDVSLMESSSSQQPSETRGSFMCILFSALCVACMLIVVLIVFVTAGTNVSEETIDDIGGGGSGGGGSGGGGSGDRGSGGGSGGQGGQERVGGGSANERSPTKETFAMTPSGAGPTTFQSTFEPPMSVAIPAPPVPTAPPPMSTLSTIIEITSTAIASSPTPTTSTTTTQVPLPAGSLLCTLTKGFSRKGYKFPPDGLCTIIMFDSLYDEGHTLAPPYKEDFQYFIETSAQAQLSEFGIGIEQGTCSTEDTMMEIVGNASTKIHLDKLWDDHRIYHYGLVNPDIYISTRPSNAVKLAAKGLQMISSLMYNKRDAKLRPSYTILHHWLYTDTDGNYVGMALKEVPVDIYVLLVHNEYPNIEDKNCTMVPPSLLTADLLMHLRNGTVYGVRMGISLGILARHHQEWPHTLKYAVSSGMSGRWYTPCEQGSISSHGPTGYTLGNKCGWACDKRNIAWYNQITYIAKACKDPAFNNSFYVDTVYHALVAYNVKQGLMFTYDGPQNLRTKLCISKKNATNLKYNLAAVGIELEDAKGVCGYGPFPRLHMLKKLAVFFAFNYTSADKETECLAVN